MANPFKKKYEHKNKTKKTISKAGVLIAFTAFKVIAFLMLFVVIFGFLNHFSSPSKYTTSTKNSFNGLDKRELQNGTYLGEIVDGVFSGEGEYLSLDGIKYTGSFDNSLEDGYGKCTYPNVGSFEGEFKNGLRNGKGKFKWSSGEILDGNWVDDIIQDGTYTFKDGSKYVGKFTSGDFGDGEYFAKDGTKYSGTFDKGVLINGIIDYSIPEDDTITAKLQIEYTNEKPQKIKYELNNGYSYYGDISGSAEIKYSNGDEYKGEVNKGKKSGTGIYTWKTDGVIVSKYEGAWLEDLMNGAGTFYYTSDDKPRIEGNFENGSPVGNHKYYKEDGNNFTAIFENGKCVEIK